MAKALTLFGLFLQLISIIPAIVLALPQKWESKSEVGIVVSITEKLDRTQQLYLLGSFGLVAIGAALQMWATWIS